MNEWMKIMWDMSPKVQGPELELRRIDWILLETEWRIVEMTWCVRSFLVSQSVSVQQTEMISIRHQSKDEMHVNLSQTENTRDERFKPSSPNWLGGRRVEPLGGFATHIPDFDYPTRGHLGWSGSGSGSGHWALTDTANDEWRRWEMVCQSHVSSLLCLISPVTPVRLHGSVVSVMSFMNIYLLSIYHYFI